MAADVKRKKKKKRKKKGRKRKEKKEEKIKDTCIRALALSFRLHTLLFLRAD